MALAVALNVEPGGVRDLAFAVFFIGTVSTLLVNGNPLLRFDGYHVMTDALQLPNLATRSTRHWFAWLRRHVLRAPAETTLFPAAGELRWLWAYAPLALVYRIVICAAIVVWLGRLSFLLGVAMALYFVWAMAAKPLVALWGFLQGPALAEPERVQARRRAMFAGAALLALVGLLPLPFSSVVQGVVWLPEHARVRAETEGFVDEIRVADGEAVRAGQTLFTLAFPDARARARAPRGPHHRARDRALPVAAHRPCARGRRRTRTRRGHRRAGTRRRAPGVARGSRRRRWCGRDQPRGRPARALRQTRRLAGACADREPTTVRVAIPHEQAALVQADTRAVSVRLAEDQRQAWRGELLRDVAGTVTKLPSAALGDRGGGNIVTDPSDKQGLTPAHGVVLADVRLDAPPGQRGGEQVGESMGEPTANTGTNVWAGAPGCVSTTASRRSRCRAHADCSNCS